MAQEQLPLFRRKSFPVILKQGIPVTPPSPESRVLATLPAYYVYLQSQGYSHYTPADFCSNVKKIGLFLPEMPLKDITTHDVCQWVEQLRRTMTAKTISRK